MSKRSIGLVFLLVCFCALLSGAPSVWAEEWPTKHITMIVPFNAGGGADVSARLLAKHWEKELGVKVVVENRPGAQGQVGATHFLSLPDDGEYVLAGAQIYYSTNIILQDAPYAIDDIAALNFTEIDPCCLVVTPESPYRTFAELHAAIQANPGKLRLGVDRGSPVTIMAHALKEHFNWDIKIINYEGGPQMQTALLGKHIDMGVGVFMSCLGKERFLALWSNERHPAIPDVPTLNEVMGKELPLVGMSRFIAVRSSVKEKYPERYRVLLETLEKTHRNPDYLQELEKSGRIKVTRWLGPDKSGELNRRLHEMTVQYKELLSGSK